MVTSRPAYFNSISTQRNGPEDKATHTACCDDVSVSSRTSRGMEADNGKPRCSEEWNANSFSIQKKKRGGQKTGSTLLVAATFPSTAEPAKVEKPT